MSKPRLASFSAPSLLAPLLLSAAAAPPQHAPSAPGGNTSLGQSAPLGVPVFELVSPDPQAFESFGTSVAMDGGTLVVGQYIDWESCTGQFCRRGAAYVFESSPAGIAPGVTKLVAPGPDPDDLFGTPVAIDRDLVAVGAGDETGPAAFFQGAVYLFERDAGGPGAWGWTAKLTASDPQNYDRFGAALDVDGDTVVVSAEVDDLAFDLGAVYVFERDADTGAWDEVAKLYPSQIANGTDFGISLDLDGETLAVGTRDHDVYVFERDPALGWVETAVLPMPSPQSIGFGRYVALDGDTLVTGAHFESAPEVNSGAAYVFVRDPVAPAGWSLETKLLPSDGQALDNFGVTVAVSGKTILVATPYDDDLGASSGKVYAFRRCGDPEGWCEAAKILAPDGAGGDLFGWAVAVQGRQFLLGAPGRSELAYSAGAAYLRAFLHPVVQTPPGWIATPVP